MDYTNIVLEIKNLSTADRRIYKSVIICVYSVLVRLTTDHDFICRTISVLFRFLLSLFFIPVIQLLFSRVEITIVIDRVRACIIAFCSTRTLQIKAKVLSRPLKYLLSIEC